MKRVGLKGLLLGLFCLISFLSDAQTAQVYRHPYLRIQLRRLPATWEIKSYKDQIQFYAPKIEGLSYDGENISINGFEIPAGETCNTVYKRYVTDGLSDLENYYEISRGDTMVGGKTFQQTTFTFQEEGKMWKDVMCTLCMNNRFYIFLLTATPKTFERHQDVYWDLLFFSKPD